MAGNEKHGVYFKQSDFICLGETSVEKQLDGMRKAAHLLQLYNARSRFPQRRERLRLPLAQPETPMQVRVWLSNLISTASVFVLYF